MKAFLIFVLLTSVLYSCKTDEKPADLSSYYKESHRPQLHFTPEAHWMNDPNGMVYSNGEYHLFYQHYPDSTVWGPMHWGHATTTDLFHWKHLPIALFPDSIGMIFSGSAVFDEKNTSGLGSADNPPLVAIFTYHNAEMEKQGRVDYQTQGIAFSSDNGKTWTKYSNNPVLKNPGIKDFRDPKVFWHEASEKWVMILAVLDHVEFYGSPDLKNWTKLSDFGKEYGSHGGVWECPDLFEMKVNNSEEKKWVLLLSINPGGPNGGSGTQYFIGDFDGKIFSSETQKLDTVWVDYGADNYAGVTWSNIPKEDGRRIFLGWMSNWNYANVVPTSPWRSAMTVPRILSLEKIGDQVYVRSEVAKELDKLVDAGKTFDRLTVSDSIDLSPQLEFSIATSRIKGIAENKSFVLEFSNDLNQKVKIGYDAENGFFFVDRSASGKMDFSRSFNPISYAPRVVKSEKIKFEIILDVSSAEVFFDDGITVMTNLFFPDSEFNRFKIYTSTSPVIIDSLRIEHLNSVWR